MCVIVQVVLALEGGYNLPSISDASEACVRALTGEDLPPISEHELARPPCQSALETLQNVIAVQVRLSHFVFLEDFGYD